MARTIVITGASSGIGAAVATQLAARGDRVVLAARRGDELDRLAKALGPHAFPVVTDVTVRAEVEHLRDRAIERFGEIDVWINNAGRGLSQLVAEVTDDELDQMMTVNVKSALYGMQAILPHFKARGVRADRQRLVVPEPRADGLDPLRLQRVEGRAQQPDREPADGSGGRAIPGIHVTLVMPGLVVDRIRRARRARHAADPPGAGGRRAQTAEEVAAVDRRRDRRPVAEVFTNPALAAHAPLLRGRRRDFEDVGAFERIEGGIAAILRR